MRQIAVCSRRPCVAARYPGMNTREIAVCRGKQSSKATLAWRSGVLASARESSFSPLTGGSAPTPISRVAPTRHTTERGPAWPVASDGRRRCGDRSHLAPAGRSPSPNDSDGPEAPTRARQGQVMPLAPTSRRQLFAEKNQLTTCWTTRPYRPISSTSS